MNTMNILRSGVFGLSRRKIFAVVAGLAIFAGSSIAQNLINNGTITNTGTFKLKNGVTGIPSTMTGVVDYNGSDQTVPASQYERLFLTGSGTKTTSGGNFTVTDSIAVAAAVTLRVPFGTVVTLDGTLSELGYIAGQIKQTVDLSGATTSSDFGGIGVTISWSGSAPGSTAVTRTTDSTLTGNGNQSIKRFFNIVPATNNGLNATIVLKYENSELDGQDSSTLVLWRSIDGGATWRKQGGVVVDANTRTITKSNAFSFSMFAISDSVHPLGPSVIEGLTVVSAGNGNWGSPSTWSGGSVPGDGQIAVIQNGNTVTATASVSVGGVIVDSGGTLIVTDGYLITAGGQTGSVINGTLTIPDAGGIAGQYASTLSIGAGGTINDKGGAFTSGWSSITVDTAANWKYMGNSQTMRSIYTALNDLALADSGMKTLGANLKINGKFSLHDTTTFSPGDYALTYGSAATLEYRNLQATTGPEFVSPFTGSGGVIIDVNPGGFARITGGQSGGWADDARPLTKHMLGNDSPLSAGTIELDASKEIDGPLTLKSGILSIGTNTLTVNGVLTVVSGALLGGSTSNVVFGGSGSATLPAVTLNDLTLNRATGVTMAGDLTVGGTLTLSSGSLAIGSNTITLNGPVTTTSGSFTGSSSSNMVIGGTGPSTSVPALTLNNLTLNRSNGISLDGNVTVGGTLTLSGGILSTASNALSLGTAASVSTSGSGRIEGTVTRSFTGSETGIKRLFTPSDNYITIVSAGITAITVQSFPNTLIPELTPGSDTTRAVYLRYYHISSVTGSGIVNLRLDYLASEQGSNFVNTSGTFWKKATLGDPGNNPWVDQTAEAAQSFYVEKSAISVSNLNGYYAMAAPNAALPVQLSSFGGTVEGNNVLLNWETLSEVNCFGFYVQRRGETEPVFVDLPNSFVEGHGTTLEPHYYSWTNQNVQQGRYDYRLRMVDNDGSVTYSSPIEIIVATPLSVRDGDAVPAVFKLNQNFPNPFNPATKISFSLGEPNFTTLKVYNVLGQEVATLFNAMADQGRLYVVTFDASRYGNGVYFYRLESGKNVDVHKMVMMK